MADNIFGWLGMKEEKLVLESALKHIELLKQEMVALLDVFRFYAAGKMDDKEEAMFRVSDLEGQADEIKRQTLLELSERMVMPPDREDLVRLIKGLDYIADQAKEAARLLRLTTDVAPDPIPEKLIEFVELLNRSVEHLERAAVQLLKKDKKNTLAECTEVEIIEEEGDDRKRELMQLVLSSELPCPMLILQHDLIESLEDCCDYIEGAADFIRLLTVKYH